MVDNAFGGKGFRVARLVAFGMAWVSCVMLVFAACVAMDGGVPLGRVRGGGSSHGAGGRLHGGQSNGPGHVVLVSAVGFPEGFDWRRDSVYGAVNGASLLLFQGEDTVLSIPAGIPPVGTLSPDMAHFVDGHLYVETIDGAETVVLRDGEELFRYSGREVIRGVMHHGGALYTLGQNRGGGGFSLRRDGEMVFGSAVGYVCGSMGDLGYGQNGALYDGGDGPTFSYWRQTYADDGPLSPREWYFVSGGTQERVLFAGDWATVFDARRIAGRNCFVVMKSDGRRPVLCVGADEYDLSGTLLGEGAADYRMYEVDDSVRFYGSYNYTPVGHPRYSPYELVNTACWSSAGRVVFYTGEGHLYADSLGTAFIKMSGGKISKILAPSGTYVLDDSCRIFSHDCACLAGNDFYVALTPSAGKHKPRLWHDGRESEVPVNGYLTGVYVTDPSSVSWIHRD